MSLEKSCPLTTLNFDWVEFGRQRYLFGSYMPEQCMRCVEVAFNDPSVTKTTTNFDLSDEDIPTIGGDPNYDMFFGINYEPVTDKRNGVYMVDVEDGTGEPIATESYTDFQVKCQNTG